MSIASYCNIRCCCFSRCLNDDDDEFRSDISIFVELKDPDVIFIIKSLSSPTPPALELKTLYCFLDVALDGQTGDKEYVELGVAERRKTII